MTTATINEAPKGKTHVLGRSAATGRYVMAPVVTKKSIVSDKRIMAAVQSVHASKK